MTKRLERIFWIVSAVALGVFFLSVGERWLYQWYLTWEFAEMVKPPAAARPPSLEGSPSAPGWRREARARQGEATREAPHEGEHAVMTGQLRPHPPYGHPLPVGEGTVVGRLDIPSIHFSAMIAEGVDNSTLRRSVGHVPGTALPGLSGNVALSAHRDTFFRDLRELQKNDLISVTTVNGTFEYAVEYKAIVEPDNRTVLRDIGRPTLTLITCYPFNYIGPAPKRFVVHAALVLE